ncbi:DNA repair RAD5 [Fusarium albosuccineum]|uniref:DNA repair RAD5 n=1 Tax=Fusarium albosuccineum TaxID=1237068 RepID=A0A8H4L786_9HYPO|nr:DNA repair RAD5 [Fusarium albosuccineum]
MLADNPLLIEASPAFQHEPRKGDIQSRLLAEQIETIFAEWKSQDDNSGAADTVDALSFNRFLKFEEFFNRKLSARGTKPKGKGKATRLAENTQAEAPSSGSTSSAAPGNGQSATYAEGNFHYAEDEVDATYSPEEFLQNQEATRDWEKQEDSDDEECDDEGDSDDPTARIRRKGRGDAEFTRRCKEMLSQASDAKVFSARINAIIRQVREIRQQDPDAKIIITSEFVMFLDNIREAPKSTTQAEDIFQFEVQEYNGTVKPVTKRAKIVRQFNCHLSGPWVLSLSAQARGVGLNLARATHVIISEPSRTPGLRIQVAGRAHRLPQDKTVHVYDLLPSNSEIDKYVSGKTDLKFGVMDTLLQPVVRQDDDYFVEPELRGTG